MKPFIISLTFYGDRQSLLYYFYLGAHKQLLGYYQDMEITDRLPLDGFYNGGLKFLQDIVAPFYIFLHTEFSSRFTGVDDVYHPTQIEIKSEAIAKTGNGINRKIETTLLLQNDKIQVLTFKEGNKTITAACTD